MNAAKALAEPYALPLEKVLVCIPAFNEEGNIGRTLDGIDRLPDRAGFDVLVIDDGSVDHTRAICAKRNVTVVSHIYNLGYGAALKTAYKYAMENGYDYIVQMDADGQHDPACVGEILEALRSKDKPDIIIGSRFLSEGRDFRMPVYKRITLSFFTFVILVGTGNRVTDPTSGLQGLARRAFSLYAQYDRFALDFPDANMIIQMALSGFSIREIPALMHERETGVSMHKGLYKKLKYMVKMMISVLIIYLRGSLDTKKARDKSA